MKVSVTTAAFFRALAWVGFGVAFGLALVLLILMSPIFFVQHKTHLNVSDILHEEFIAFLGVALIGGASSDYVLSVNFKWYFKIIIALCVLVMCITVFSVFNPAVETLSDAKKEFTKYFSVICLILCLGVKSVIFAHEEHAHKRLKRLS